MALFSKGGRKGEGFASACAVLREGKRRAEGGEAIPGDLIDWQKRKGGGENVYFQRFQKRERGSAERKEKGALGFLLKNSQGGQEKNAMTRRRKRVGSVVSEGQRASRQTYFWREEKKEGEKDGRPT